MKKQRVILTKDVDSIGHEGDTLTVARGFARNFLIPNGLALPNNNFAQNLMQSREKKLVHAQKARNEMAAEQKNAIESDPLIIEMLAGENGKLFGSVTALAIQEQLLKRSITINKSAIKVPKAHINEIGDYTIPIALTHDVHAALSLQVKAQNAQ